MVVEFGRRHRGSPEAELDKAMVDLVDRLAANGRTVRIARKAADGNEWTITAMAREHGETGESHETSGATE
jgi:hypothetical protein